MTDAERMLLIWCAQLLLRSVPVDADEISEITSLIADIRRQMEVWNRKD